MHQIFVYGTLKHGFPNHVPWMETCRYLGIYRSREAYPLVVGGEWFVICLLPEPGSGLRVTGELYEVDDEGLIMLDRLESTHLPNGYRRQRISIARRAAETTDELEAWVYFKDRATIDGIHSEPMAEYLPDPRYVPPADRG